MNITKMIFHPFGASALFLPIFGILGCSGAQMKSKVISGSSKLLNCPETKITTIQQTVPYKPLFWYKDMTVAYFSFGCDQIVRFSCGSSSYGTAGGVTYIDECVPHRLFKCSRQNCVDSIANKLKPQLRMTVDEDRGPYEKKQSRQYAAWRSAMTECECVQISGRRGSYDITQSDE